ALDISANRTMTSVKPVAVEAGRTTQPLEPVAAPQTARKVVTSAVVEPFEIISTNDADWDDLSGVLTIDEIEPVDYLEAEIRKVDRALTAELHRDARPSRLSHLFTGMVDLCVIALSA